HSPEAHQGCPESRQVGVSLILTHRRCKTMLLSRRRILAILSLSLGFCLHQAPAQKENHPPGPEAQRPPAGKAKRLTPIEAEELVFAHLFPKAPDILIPLPLKELTTDAVWKRLGAQVFQVTGKV